MDLPSFAPDGSGDSGGPRNREEIPSRPARRHEVSSDQQRNCFLTGELRGYLRGHLTVEITVAGVG